MKDIWRIISATRKLWRYYAVIGTFTVALAALNLLMPFLSGKAIDNITSHHPSVSYLVAIALIIFAADLLYNVCSNIGGYFGDQMAAKVQRILSLDYYKHVLSLSQSYFDTELTGKIINRLNRSIYQIANFMQVLSNNFLQFIFSTVLALVIVAIYSWPVALMLLALYPIFGYLTVKTGPRWRDWQHEENGALDISSGRFAEVVNEIRVVKSFNQQARELKFFGGWLNRYVSLTKPQSRYWHKWDFWRRVAMNIVFIGVFVYIFIEAAYGHLTPGDAVALILYGMQIRLPLFTISFLVSQTQRAMADSREYFRAMAEKPAFSDKPGAAQLTVDKAGVSFNDVSFSYEASQPVLKAVSFELEPNTKSALVGESGEGKTTIANLLLRMYEVGNGEIAIDGQNIAEVTQESLRANIGVVFQDPALFSGTIRENISYADPKASESAIVAAAEAANAREFIDKFEKGLDTEIGERGVKLSGGQKQRIAIARALLKDAPILVLDEATSSLDSRSELLVQQALARLMQQRTTLIIAHRLSTISHVDKIITLKEGRIDEIGTPYQLASSGGIYEQLLKLQQGHTKAGETKLKRYEIKA